MSELKACPFFGGTAFVQSYDYPERPSFKWNAHVVCRRCTASVTAKDGFENSAKTAEGKAISAWNKRAGDKNE